MSYKTKKVLVPRGELFDRAFQAVGKYPEDDLRKDLLALVGLAPKSKKAAAIYVEAAHRPHQLEEFTGEHYVTFAWLADQVKALPAPTVEEDSEPELTEAEKLASEEAEATRVAAKLADDEAEAAADAALIAEVVGGVAEAIVDAEAELIDDEDIKPL
jgi:hypothetical protein